MNRWRRGLRRSGVSIAVQIAIVAVSYILSFLLRFDLDPQAVLWSQVGETLPILVVVRVGAIVFFRLHQGLWRYVGVLEMIQIVKASTVSSVAFTAIVLLAFGFDEVPRSVFVIDWAGTMFLLSGARLVTRVASERVMHLRESAGIGAPRRLLIIGAGDAGAVLSKQIMMTPTARLQAVAFLDDEPLKVGASIEGVPIVGTVSELGRVAGVLEIDLAVIAVPSATPEERRQIVEHCQRAGVEFKVLPATPDIINGAVSVASIREVDPVDLLGRPPAHLDQDAMEAFFKSRRVLITGAAGSVGSELAAQVARFGPERLVLIDQAENPLLFLESELRVVLGNGALEVRIADVTDEASMRELMERCRPHIVLHAAAHKHVNFMEQAPAKAVKNNVGGTYAVARSAQAAGVETFILISTDKAVKPANVMGATKRLSEMLVLAMDHEGPTRFSSVRFGNVLGSNASVVPIFRRQIIEGGPLTVTHPDVTRYFMSIPEAAGLVLQAAAVSDGGDTFVLDMGEPIRIVALAKMMITLCGLSEDDVEIVYTGLRPGEKLHEALKTDAEELLETGHEKLMVLGTKQPVGTVISQVERLLEALPESTDSEARAGLQRLVPEYEPVTQVQAPPSSS